MAVILKIDASKLPVDQFKGKEKLIDISFKKLELLLTKKDKSEATELRGFSRLHNAFWSIFGSKSTLKSALEAIHDQINGPDQNKEPKETLLKLFDISNLALNSEEKNKFLKSISFTEQDFIFSQIPDNQTSKHFEISIKLDVTESPISFPGTFLITDDFCKDKMLNQNNYLNDAVIYLLNENVNEENFKKKLDIFFEKPAPESESFSTSDSSSQVTSESESPSTPTSNSSSQVKTQSSFSKTPLVLCGGVAGLLAFAAGAPVLGAIAVGTSGATIVAGLQYCFSQPKTYPMPTPNLNIAPSSSLLGEELMNLTNPSVNLNPSPSVNITQKPAPQTLVTKEKISKIANKTLRELASDAGIELPDFLKKMNNYTLNSVGANAEIEYNDDELIGEHVASDDTRNSSEKYINRTYSVTIKSDLKGLSGLFLKKLLGSINGLNEKGQLFFRIGIQESVLYNSDTGEILNGVNDISTGIIAFDGYTQGVTIKDVNYDSTLKLQKILTPIFQNSIPELTWQCPRDVS